MKLTIFSRLIIGYLAILILAMAVSIYAISQLRQLENITRSILTVDNRLVDYEQKLSDILLSMMRYEKKYIIIKDEGIYNQFLLAKDDFKGYLDEIMPVADDPQIMNLFTGIMQNHQRYQTLFDEEVRYLSDAKEYSIDWYKVEKEKAVNEIMEGLKTLRAYSQKMTYSKLKKLGEAEVNASKVAMVIGEVSLILGIIISTFITINITKPLSLIKKKTRDIAEGNFESDLNLSSPPEIGELAKSFNFMCAKLKEIDKMKSDFFSLMSHELRTPLTTIKEGTNLFLEGLRERKASEKQKRLMTIINEECNRLINLVNSLLELSKMEAGMMDYNFTPTNMTPLISKVTREMEPLAETKNITIETDVSEELPLIKIDSSRILQVLRNLIGNAVKFTTDGGIVKVSAWNMEGEIKVSVADTGQGVSEEKISAIFDKFQQAALAGSNKIKGTGLGLFIVKQIITAHGGKIWVESNLGQGSIFTFVLPA